MRVVYVHGLPGSGAELAIAPLPERERPVVVPPWAGSLPSDGPVHRIGFSLGAFGAVRLLAARPERVARLDLVSPAAPLELGDFLPAMAGRAVFEMARSRPRVLAAAVAAQGVAARAVPLLLARALFASADPVERDLLREPGFRALLVRGLRHSLIEHRGEYLSTLADYVAPWASRLDSVRCPVRIRHGTADRWAPVGMAHALDRALGARSRLRVLDGLGHYGALRAALPQLLATDGTVSPTAKAP